MAVNAPEVVIIDDTSHSVTAKVTAYFQAATNSNTVIVQANTLFGANTSGSFPCCKLDVVKVQYETSLANGYIQLQYQSSVNANVVLANFGRNDSGVLSALMQNNANTPTGNLMLCIQNALPHDSFTLLITAAKDNTGNLTNYAAGGWANGFVNM